MSKMMKLNNKKSILKIRAATTLDEIFTNPDCPEILKRALEMNSWHERNEYTLEDSLRSTSLNPFWVSVLLALDAHLDTNDNKSEKLSKFLSGKGKKGKIKALTLSVEVPGRRLGEAFIGMTPSDKPIVSAVAALSIIDGKVKDVKLAMTGVWNQDIGLVSAVNQLKGAVLKDKIIDKVSNDVGKEVKPRGDYRGSVEYRKSMAVILSKRALEMCR